MRVCQPLAFLLAGFQNIRIDAQRLVALRSSFASSPLPVRGAMMAGRVTLVRLNFPYLRIATGRRGGHY